MTKDIPHKISALFHPGWKLFWLGENKVKANLNDEQVIFEDKREQTRIICSDVVLRDDIHESIPGSTRVGSNIVHCKTLFR